MIVCEILLFILICFDRKLKSTKTGMGALTNIFYIIIIASYLSYLFYLNSLFLLCTDNSINMQLWL